MSLSRRTLLVSTAAGVLGAKQLRALDLPWSGARSAGSGAGLRILFLGGTGFIGPHMVRKALEHGHKISLFTRGRTGKDLFPEAEKLIGNRNGQLEALKGKTWDVVIDNSGYVPEHVQASAELLKGSVGHYFFTSTLDAYRDYHTPNIDESYPLATLPAGTPHDPSKYYGPLKALCEEAVVKVYPTNHTIIRPGWIVGPGDNNHLFTYWVVRFDRGGDVLAPGTPNDPAQVIDARDLADWVLRLVESKTVGRFNAVGPVIDFGQLLYGMKAVTAAPSTITWVDSDFLKREKVRPYFDVPLWWPPRNDYNDGTLPSGLDGGVGALNVSGAKARAAGLVNRPLADIARDTLAWYKSEYKDWPEDKRPGLSAAREKDLLASWRAK